LRSGLSVRRNRTQRSVDERREAIEHDAASAPRRPGQAFHAAHGIRTQGRKDLEMARKKIDRIAQRPDPAAWGRDEIISLGEAARLYWPNGPITEKTLRWCVKNGRLPISKVAGKFFVTGRALATLSECKPVHVRNTEDDADAGSYLADLAAIDRMGR
jgi:hypothetical protein